jgi:hypothetical protein
MQPRIVADDQHQPAMGADIGLRHQRVGRDVEPDMLHRDHGAHARQRGADGDVERHLLVDRPFGGDVGGGIFLEGFENLGRGGAGIGAGDLDARLPRPARDGLVAHQRQRVLGAGLPGLNVHGFAVPAAGLPCQGARCCVKRSVDELTGVNIGASSPAVWPKV